MKKNLRIVLTAFFLWAAFWIGMAPAVAAKMVITPENTDNIQSAENMELPGAFQKILYAPSNLVATSTVPGIVTLTWKDNSDNETGFIIERKSGSMDFCPITSVGANTTTYEESESSTYPVFPGETYYYRVRACNNSGQSACSNEVSVVVNNDSIPIPPGNLQAEPHVSGKVRLTWDDRSNNEAGFEVQRQMEGGQYETLTSLSPGTEEYIVDKKMNGGVRYTFRIKVYNAGGSSFSNTDSVMVPTHEPRGPSNFHASPVGSTAVKLVWDDNSDNEYGFRISLKKTYEGSYPPYYNPSIHLAANVNEYLNLNLEPDTDYSYIIDAYNLAGSSTAAEATVKTGPKPPVITTAIASGDGITLRWFNPSNNILGYKIERKTEGESYALLTVYTSQDCFYTDNNVAQGNKYYYRVSSWRNPFYPSDPSAEISVTVPRVLNPGQAYHTPQSPPVSGHGSMDRSTQEQSQTFMGSLPAGDITGKIISLNIGKTDYSVNGEVRRMDTAPVTLEGRTMLPVRYVAEPLGADVAWDEAAQKVTVTLGDKVLELWIGKNTAKVKGQEVMIDPGNPGVMPLTVPPGRTMLPVRFISENLGCRVEWDDVAQEARLIYGQ